jgi:hypothetical protein
MSRLTKPKEHHRHELVDVAAGVVTADLANTLSN